MLKVAPYVGAWIETTEQSKGIKEYESHPMWVRGLKQHHEEQKQSRGWSHPMWVRGLKLFNVWRGMVGIIVAPYVGAWIETCGSRFVTTSPRRTLCGCVD